MTEGSLLEALTLDAMAEVTRISDWLRMTVGTRFKRRGAVVGISGGVDSAVTASLAVHAFGADNVLGLLMPEGESDPESLDLGHIVAKKLGIATAVEDIAGALRGFGCYRRRDDALRSVIPEYGQGWGFKLVLPPLLGDDRYRIFSAVAQSPDGRTVRVRLPPEVYRAIVAATSFKQRTRKVIEYYHADSLHYAVLGTPNRLEYDQGFFVKGGDGAADVKPIAHLYKSQVYQLAACLDVPQEIIERPPTTDTYSLPQSQEEFFFSVPYRTLDLCLYAIDAGVPAQRVAEAVGLDSDDVGRIFHDIDRKRSLAIYLHAAPAVHPAFDDVTLR